MLIPLVSATTLVGTLLLAPGVAQASEMNYTDAPTSTVSQVQGTVDDSTGSPVGAGWGVSLWAQANGATLGTLQVGDAVPELEVSSTTTDANGNFTLSAGSNALPAEYINDDGTTNYNVISDAAGQHQTYNLTFVSATAPTTSANVSRAAVSRTSARHIVVRTFPGLKTPRTSAALKRASVEPDTLCNQYHVVKLYPSRHVQVGEAYTSSHSKASFTYTSDANTTFEVGFSSGMGAFSASGESSSSSTSTQGFGAISGGTGRKWVTGFDTEKFEKDCDDGSKLYLYQASKFEAGDYSESSVAFSSNSHCIPERTGDFFNTTQTNSEAYKFGGGLESSNDIGINLTAETGWDNKTAVSFTFSGSVQFCGASDKPAGTPRRLKTTG